MSQLFLVYYLLNANKIMSRLKRSLVNSNCYIIFKVFKQIIYHHCYFHVPFSLSQAQPITPELVADDDHQQQPGRAAVERPQVQERPRPHTARPHHRGPPGSPTIGSEVSPPVSSILRPNLHIISSYLHLLRCLQAVLINKE